MEKFRFVNSEFISLKTMFDKHEIDNLFFIFCRKKKILIDSEI